jgi:D-serine deaminase-like pyridoxal phosphate-dependent protein
MHIYDLDTPALVIDLDVLERNIRDMAAHCAGLGIALRVHTKTHKIPEIAHMQVAAGSQGIVCQKLGEAEVMARAGLDDILITYNIVGQQKLRRLSDLARLKTVTVTVDSEDVAWGLSRQAEADGVQIGVLVELDTGGQRTGVRSPQAALALGQTVAGLPGLTLRGLMTYPSHIRARPILRETRDLFNAAGLPCPVISGGGTGDEATSVAIGCTETRSGSYVYEGMTRIRGRDDLDPARCALSIVCTVVSVSTAPGKASADRIIIDGGQKTFRTRPPDPYGLIVEHPQALLRRMSVEHGHVDVSSCAHRFRVGDKVSVIPEHQGMAANMHDEAFGARNGQVEVVWAIRGRGKVK